jgi:hypothetical protein
MTVAHMTAKDLSPRVLHRVDLALLLKLRVENPQRTSRWLARELSSLSGNGTDRKSVSRTLIIHGLPTERASARLSARGRTLHPLSSAALNALILAAKRRVGDDGPDGPIKIRHPRKRVRTLKWYTDRYRKEWRKGERRRSRDHRRREHSDFAA